MTETWVLLIAIYLTGDRGGVSITSVEFSSQAACMTAGRSMAAEWGRGGLSLRDQSRWVCTRK